MYLPIASGVWSFCQDIETKFLWQLLPASGDGPAFELISNVSARVTCLWIAIIRFDHIIPPITSTFSLLINLFANCLATSGLR